MVVSHIHGVSVPSQRGRAVGGADDRTGEGLEVLQLGGLGPCLEELNGLVGARRRLVRAVLARRRVQRRLQIYKPQANFAINAVVLATTHAGEVQVLVTAPDTQAKVGRQ